MASSSSKQDTIKDSLSAFLQANLPDIAEDSVDDIILEYVVSIVEELTAEKDLSASDFDVDDFLEMLAAYVPGAETLKPQLAVDWMMGLAQEQRAANQQKSSFDVTLLKNVIAETAERSAAKSKRTPQTSESGKEEDEETCSNGKRSLRVSTCSDVEDDEEYRSKLIHLLEMFPFTNPLEVSHCLSVMGGDIDTATGFILSRFDSGQSITDTTKPAKPKKELDDNAVKEQILSKYGFVDQEEDSRYHRPSLKSAEEKKLIRYRDGKIVSTKGERFTQVSKQECEEMKKTIKI